MRETRARLAAALLLLAAAGCGSSEPASEADSAVDSVVDRGAPDTLAPDTAADSAPPPDAAADLRDAEAHRVLPGCVQGAFHPYFGVLHAHTSYSDGEQTPADAFQYARDVAQLDVLVITDHLEQLYLPLPDDRYGKCLAQAAAARVDGAFVADCGFEYGSGFTPLLQSTGHNNVFFSPTLMPAIQLDFHDFYKSLAACPTCIGQFNHPGSSGEEHWNHFEYDGAADQRLNLFEFNSDPAWEMFFQALDAGWHVSPMCNQDNHGSDWGTKNDRRSGLLLAKLDRPSLKGALGARRTFMTDDKNATIALMADDICWMGSILGGAASMPVAVEAGDADAAEGFTTIELYGEGKVLLDSFDCQGANPCSATFAVQASQSPYFVARAAQADGDLLVSAPVWLTP